MDAMLERPLRILAIAASLLVLTGWGWFAVDETSAASRHTSEEIAGEIAADQPDPSPEAERAREQAHSPVHEVVDDANDILLKPFAPLAEGYPSTWARRTVPAVLALLLYGFGVGLLARYSRGRA
jgi:hypothetical protein